MFTRWLTSFLNSLTGWLIAAAILLTIILLGGVAEVLLNK